MNRHQRIEPRLLIGIWGACLMALIAGLASPARCQTQQASAQPDAVPAESDEGGDEEDLLEPSDTGYIDDATIGTRIRLRFDAALDADTPDRAEFIYAKCGCFRPVDPDVTGPGNAPDFNVDYQELEISYERAFSRRVSLFAELPVRAVDLGDNGVSFSGISDLRVGVKVGLVASPDRHFTFQLRAYLPTGESAEGLGTDHATLEPGLLLLQRLNDRLTLGAELKYWYPTSGNSAVGAGDPAEDFSGDILRYGIGLAYDAATGSGVELAPVVELVGWSVLDGFKTVPPGMGASADGDEILNLKVGTRVRGGFPGSFYVGYGFALTDDVWYDGIFRFEYRVSG